MRGEDIDPGRSPACPASRQRTTPPTCAQTRRPMAKDQLRHPGRPRRPTRRTTPHEPRDLPPSKAAAYTTTSPPRSPPNSTASRSRHYSPRPDQPHPLNGYLVASAVWPHGAGRAALAPLPWSPEDPRAWRLAARADPRRPTRAAWAPARPRGERGYLPHSAGAGGSAARAWAQARPRSRRALLGRHRAPPVAARDPRVIDGLGLAFR